MKSTYENEPSNVIEVSFNKIKPPSTIEEFESHLNSLVEVETKEINDPLTELLDEFEEQSEVPVDSEYNYSEFRVGYSDDLLTMTNKLQDQLKEIKLSSSRLSYFLSEMNFDD